MILYFYPRSPCGERPRETTSIKPIFSISIHALLAESDMIHPHLCDVKLRFLSTLSLRRATFLPHLSMAQVCYFYPRSPCGERLKIRFLFRLSKKFLSTLSLRRATFLPHLSMAQVCYFYPRSPCGERHPSLSGTAQHTYFYPRSPCGERHWGPIVQLDISTFLSTLSLRRATLGAGKSCDVR